MQVLVRRRQLRLQVHSVLGLPDTASKSENHSSLCSQLSSVLYITITKFLFDLSFMFHLSDDSLLISEAFVFPKKRSLVYIHN